MPAMALTDHGNMYGAIDFYKECLKHDIKPIIGVEIYVAPSSRFNKKRESRGAPTAYHLILLCKNEEGYRNLCYLTSKGFTEGFYYHPRIDKELLAEHSSGLICLSGCLSGSVAQAALKSEEELEQEILFYRDIFKDDFYLELQLHEMIPQDIALISEDWLKQDYYSLIESQKKVNGALLTQGQKFGISCVATNDSHYLNAEDFESHEILLNVQSGETTRIAKNDLYVPNPKRKVYKSREYYFKSPLQMEIGFKNNPEALTNTLEIADKCFVPFDFNKKYYPVYMPPGFEDKTDYDETLRYSASGNFLKRLCNEGIARKYTPELLKILADKFPGQDPMNIIRNRLEKELSVIISKGMCDYLLIVWDIIQWAKNHNIPVGPGRGSGAGSIILFLIDVTSIEPLRFDLFFERFINPERISYPDIDIDICMSGREQVINYAAERYGKDNVAQIITFGTMKAKMAVKDVGRVLDIPLAEVNVIAKFIPETNTPLEKAVEIDSDLQNLYLRDKKAKFLIDMAQKLEGCIRNTGVHAAGVIISNEKLMERIPICLPKDSSMITTQFSMKPLEAIGMLKVDFLGLKTLTSIDIALKSIAVQDDKKLRVETLPLDDKNTFKLLHQGKTLGVFQMESSGMQELSKQLQPDCFEEIIAIGALYRPGPMDMIPSFINRKHKREPIEYDHPLMETILKETYGIMVYQEQVMQIAQTLAGYSPGEGDVLRRAMGKKDALQMLQEREKFCLGAYSNDLSEETATAIFDKMEKFASYGFNKSHAAAYGLITYATAYLKANHPKQWMAALLTSDRDDIDKLGKLLRECRNMGISILPPDINESGVDFVATQSGIRFAMPGIKGISYNLVETVIEERNKNGPFISLKDFMKRVDLSRVTKKSLDLLIDSGCFDFTGNNKDALKMRLESTYDAIHKEKKEAATGVLTLFSLIDAPDNYDDYVIDNQQTTLVPRNECAILKKEKELLGFYLTKHPMDRFAKYFKYLSCIPFSEIQTLDHGTVFRSAFIIDKVTVKVSSKGQKKFAVLKISDLSESIELPIWSDLFDSKSHLLEEDNLIYAILVVDKRSEVLRLSCRWMDSLISVIPDSENPDNVRNIDEIYEKIKYQLAKSNSFKDGFLMSEKKSSASGSEKSDQTASPIHLKISIDKMTLSHFLTLKTYLKKHPGNSPVILNFFFNDRKFAVIHPGKAFCVGVTDIVLKDYLKKNGFTVELLT